jgi:rod shape-determining protein MreC
MAANRDDVIIAIRYALLKKGAKQKFSLIFLISFSIGIIFLDRLSLPLILSTRAVINDFVYQVSAAASTPGKFISYLGKIKEYHFKVVDKNKILEEEIKILKRESYESVFLKNENEFLKKALELSSTPASEEDVVVAAKVIMDQNSPYLRSLLINKGKNQGIIKGMSVFSDDYLVGRVIESNFLTARVLLITDLNSKIPVIIQDTDANGLLVGVGKKTALMMEYLPDEFLLEPNKIIFTSGKDGVLAAGMPVAETYLNKKNKVLIKSLANPQQALIVYVTKGKMNNRSNYENIK